jgi:polyferredoxin
MVNLTIQRARRGFDLLKFPPIRNLVLWRGFPYVFQAGLLLFFIALIILGWGRFAPAGVNAKLFAKTNLVTLLVWGLWWPAMVWIAVLFGRVWCMVCPLELVSNVSERLGRRLGIRQRPLRRWLLSGVAIVSLYALIQLFVAGAKIHRVPAYTALFLLGLLSMAFLTSLLFKDRAFCRAFCPVGQLLAIYGRGGMLAVRADSAQVCKDCAGKPCLATCNRTKMDARSCPSLLNPPRLDTNRDCLVCTQCIKSCQPDNMLLLLRRPFPRADAREPLASWPTTAFVMLVSGFVTWELCTEWPAAEVAFLTVPQWLSTRMGVTSVSGYLNGLWALLVVPLVTWSMMALLLRRFDVNLSVGLAWRRLALPVAIIVSAGHMSKGLAKFVSWAGFLPQALKDPTGAETLQAITTKVAPEPSLLLSVPTVSAISILLLTVALFMAVRETKLSNSQAHKACLVPQFALASGFVLIVLGWALK